MPNRLVEKARNEIFLNGYTVLENVVSLDGLDLLQAQMNKDAEKLVLLGINKSYGSVAGHLQLNPPPFIPYLLADIIANKTVCAITKSILGNDLINGSYSGNTNCPGSKPQPVHCDYGHLQARHTGDFPANLIVNIVLEDVTTFNGSTEIWPGSHHDQRFVCDFMDSAKNKCIHDSALIARRAEYPPIQLDLKKGSVVIRDPRMWHRGMVNHSKNFRHMIAMIHAAAWVDPGLAFRFHTHCKPIFDESPIKHNMIYVDEPFDYLTVDFLAD